jgi:hypothetical protein
MPCPSQGSDVVGGFRELGVARFLRPIQEVLEGVRVIPICRCTLSTVAGVAEGEGYEGLLARGGALGVSEGAT